MSVEMLTLLLVVWCSVRKTNMYCSYSTLSTAVMVTVLIESCSLQNKVKQHVYRVIIESACCIVNMHL